MARRHARRERRLEDDDWHLTDQLHVEHGKADPFAAAVRATRMPMIICDARQDDIPIVFANAAFLGMTGYRREEVVGRNCRFLQGAETDRASVARIRAAIERRVDIQIDILNYRKDGSTFWNALYISPVMTEDGDLQFFFASQLDVTERKRQELRIRAEKEEFEAAVHERTRSLQVALDAKNTLLHEVDHRVKNNLQTIVALVAMEARQVRDEQTRAAFGRLMRRVEAVATVHRRLYEEAEVDRFDVGGFARALLDQLSGAAPVRIIATVAADSILVPAAWASPLALLLNELVLEAPDRGASAELEIARIAPDRFRIVVQPAAPDAAGRSGIIRRLVRQLGGEVRPHGARLEIELPLEPERAAR